MVFEHRGNGSDGAVAYGAGTQNPNAALARDAELTPRVIPPVLDTTQNPDQFRPASLVPSTDYDLQATFDHRIALRRALISMRDVYGPSSLDAISTNVVGHDQIRGAVNIWHEMFQPGIPQQRQQELNTQLTHQLNEMFQACIDNARGDRGQILANLELLRRTLNQAFQAAGSRFSFDQLQIAVDNQGRIHTAFPIVIDGRPTGIVRRVPVIVPTAPLDTRSYYA